MLSDLPSPLLRSFVAVADCGSLAAAAIRVNRSESALSLQMQRLEDIVGQPLFDRDGRALKLNGTGGWLLAHSRAILARIDAARAELDSSSRPPIRLGVVQDFVSQVLQPTLGDLRGDRGEARFSIVIGSTSELLQAMSEDRIDAAVCVGEPGIGSAGGTVLPMAWFGDAHLLDDEVVPLVSITPPCPFLIAATRALDAIGRPWRLSLVTPSLDGGQGCSRGRSRHRLPHGSRHGTIAAGGRRTAPAFRGQVCGDRETARKIRAVTSCTLHGGASFYTWPALEPQATTAMRRASRNETSRPRASSQRTSFTQAKLSLSVMRLIVFSSGWSRRTSGRR